MKSNDLLLPREWVIVVIFILLLLGISLLSLSRSSFELHPPIVHSPSEQLTVRVAGAVARPGIYTVAKEGAIALLLAQSDPLPTALLSQKIKIQHKNKEALLHIPSQEGLFITVKGAIKEEGEYCIPHKTRICDLSKHLLLSEDADPQFLKRKRFLKEGEIITIPRVKQRIQKKSK